MQTMLAGSGVFADPTLPRIERDSESGAGPIVFDLSARVVRPFSKPRGAEDFSEETLAIRIYGEEAVARYPEDLTTLASSESGENSGSSSNTARSRNTSSDPSRARVRERASERGEAQAVPDPLTDEEIASMDRSKLIKEFGARKKASSYPELDDAVKTRLKDEVAKIRERLTELRSG